MAQALRSTSALPAWATLGRQRPQLLSVWRSYPSLTPAQAVTQDGRRFASSSSSPSRKRETRPLPVQPPIAKSKGKVKTTRSEPIPLIEPPPEQPSRRTRAKARGAASRTSKAPAAPLSFIDKLRAIKVEGTSSVSSYLSGGEELSPPLAPPTLLSPSSSLAAPHPPERAPVKEDEAEAPRPTRAPYARPPLSSQPTDPLAYVTSNAMYRSGAPSAWDPTEDFEMMSRHEEMSMFERAWRRGRMDMRQYVSVIVDGDNLQFLPSLIAKGRKGGQLANRLIRRRVLDDITRANPSNASIDDVRVSVFANYSGLTNVVAGFGAEAVERRAIWADFVEGLTLSPGTLFVGVGRLPQAADIKVKAGLLQSVLDPNCVQSYLGGLDDFGYAVELTALRKLNLLQRVSLLNVPGVAGRSKFYAEYAARQVRWASDVFMGANEANREYRALDKQRTTRKDGKKEAE